MNPTMIRITLRIVLISLAVTSIKAGLLDWMSKDKQLFECTFDIKIHENGLPYATFRSPKTIRPINLIIDTGAPLTIVASDVIKPQAINENEKVTIGGFTGRRISSNGTVHSSFAVRKNAKIDVTMNVAEREFILTGEGGMDGMLGFDVMCEHKLVFEYSTKKLIYILRDSVPGGFRSLVVGLTKIYKSRVTTDLTLENNRPGVIPYVFLKSSITTRAVKLLVDTGARESIIASDVLETGVIDASDGSYFHSSIGATSLLTAQGVTRGSFTLVKNLKIEMLMHVFGREHIRYGDGMIGMDIISQYNITIDLIKKTMVYQLNGGN